ncbi:CaiB/BaiF CoA transferase family protein [Actinophytocola sp.]|uniref:CaiB/BaiF CoA transferase family protein n=1 Tax=Actinophytocola sp. TaxID=1872138 RepID=UPI003D6A15CA
MADGRTNGAGRPRLPLAGLRCIDYGVWHAGPAVTAMLADMGADVVKIENRHGDPTRRFSRYHGYSVRLPRGDCVHMQLSNRGKRSLSLDVSTERGRAIATKLIADADVFVTNLREEHLRRVRLEWADLEAINPRLVYTHVTGFGPEGPASARRAFDTLAVAQSGLLSVFNPDEPEPFLFGLGDQMAAVTGVMGVLAALHERTTTGRGQLVETSLYGALLHLVAMPLHIQLAIGEAIRPPARDEVFNPLTTWFRCRDGKWVMLSENMPDQKWPLFCVCVGREDWITDPRYENLRARGRHARELIHEIDTILATRDSDEWVRVFADADLAVAVISTLTDVATDEQATVNGYIAAQEYPDAPFTRRGAGFPVAFGGHARTEFARGPMLGEHSVEILHSLGYTNDDIRDLVDDGVVGAGDTAEADQVTGSAERSP